jgi:hypothetical protein
MSGPARSAMVFGVYLLVLGAVLVVVPGALALTGIAPPTEVWIRVVGLLAMILGYYYARAARAELLPFIGWTVAPRLLVAPAFAALVVLGFASPALVLFGLVDLAGALWTAWELRRA